MQGKVYFVAAPGRIKIGYTCQPERRLRTLRHVDMEDLAVVAIIDGDRRVERDIHERLREHRLRGEWFLDCAEVRSAIEDAVAGKFVASPCEAIESSRFVACNHLVSELDRALSRGADKLDIKLRAQKLISAAALAICGGVQ